MCDQSTLAALSGAGTAMQAGTAWQKARYEEAVLRQNAILAERGAARASQAGAAEYLELVRRGRQLEGSQRAALGAAGVDPNVGQALKLLEDSAYIGGADQQTALNEAEKQSEALRMEKSQYETAARNIKRARPYQYGTTALTGGARAYGIWKGLE